MSLPVPLRELRTAQAHRNRRQLGRLVLRWAAAVATATLVVWGSVAVEAAAAAPPHGFAPGARLAPVDPGIPRAGWPRTPGPTGSGSPPAPSPGRLSAGEHPGAQGSAAGAGERDSTLPLRIAQTLVRAVQMPLDILAEGLHPSGRPSLARVLLALWSGAGLAGPLLPDGPAQGVVDGAYTAGTGLSALTARFLEHVAATDATLSQAGLPGARGLAWALTMRRALALGLRHAFDLGDFARGLHPATVLAAIQANPGNWAATLGRTAGMAGGILAVVLGLYRVVQTLRRRRPGEDGHDRAVRALPGLLTAAAGALGILVLVTAAPATAAGAAFLATLLGLAALVLESRAVSRNLAKVLRATGWAARQVVLALGRARDPRAAAGAAPACRPELPPTGPRTGEASGEPPTVFRWDRDGVLVATEPGARFSLEGKNRVRLPRWAQERLRDMGGTVLVMWGDRAAAAARKVMGPRGAPGGGSPVNVPAGRWLASRWDAWVPVVEPGTTEVLLGRYDTEGCYTGRWRVVVGPDGTVTEKRWIAHPRRR